ncbi:ABC transporter ATP-binding protein [Thiovibrio sp. JS02]
MAIIQAQSLCKVFRTMRGKKVIALDGIDLAVQQGTIYGFVGPNGAGKSTTIKLLLDFIRPTSGTVSINSLPAADPNSRSQVGFLPENPKFYSFLTPKEFLQTVARLKGQKKKIDPDEWQRLLDKLDLRRAAQQPIHTLSKGMTQRLGLAAALVGDPAVLILDEPMSGLDPVGRNLVNQLLKELSAQGKTIFFSSHILHDVETICDEIGILLKGTLRYQGKVKDIPEQHSTDCIVTLRPEQNYEAKFPPSNAQSITANQDGTISLLIPKEGVTTFLRDNIASCEILSVVPLQKSLQDFFMELFAGEEKEELEQMYHLSPPKAEKSGS